MNSGWKIRVDCDRQTATDFSERLSNSELAEEGGAVSSYRDDDSAHGWRAEIVVEEEPDQRLVERIELLLPDGLSRRDMEIEPLAERDWVTESQSGLKPIAIASIHIRSSAYPPPTDPGVRDIVIDPGQAFGTGHHATTQGCIQALYELRRIRPNIRRIVDIGTGSGILAFAAQHFWPGAEIVASDIDPAAIAKAREYALGNGFRLGIGRGNIRLLVAAGANHRAISAAAPYDLLIANILAGPLVELAPTIAPLSAPRANLLLAGLTSDQSARVSPAYRSAGFRLEHSAGVDSEWPVLRMTARATARRHTILTRHPAIEGTGEW